MKKIYAGVAVVAVVVAFFVFRDNGTEPATLTVHPGDFVQEVSVSGKVVAAKDVDLGFSVGGRVAGVYARVGDFVGAGRVLAEIENGDLRASLEAEQAELASLKAGARPEEVAVAEADVVSARLALADAQEDAATAAANAVADIDQFISNPRSPNPQLTFSTSDSQIKNAVEAGRAVIEPALAVGHADLADVSTLLKNASAALARAIPSGSITQAIVDGYISDVAGAKTSVNAAAAALTSVSAALVSAEKTLILKKAGASKEDIDAQQARVRGAEAALAKTLIVAPFSGVVTDVDAKVGATLSASASALSLIGSDFQIESYVPEVNVALVTVGNPATATLDAYGTEVPFLAKVASIDPAETLRDGVSTYRTILAFTDKDPRIRAGMTANVRITTAERADIIAVPQGVVKARDGKKFVAVQADGVTDREVVTGMLSSTGEVEILSGLVDGDVVIIPK